MNKLFCTFSLSADVPRSKRNKRIEFVINAVVLYVQIFCIGFVFGLGFHLAS